jgi:hypothetical protein
LANLKTTKLWFKIAIRDLKNSKALIDLGTTHKHAAAYHAQQCAEKSIKGFLTHHSCRVAKTHDLAIVYRYPDAEKKPLTFAKAKSATKAAHIIYDSFYKQTFNKSDKSKFMKFFL